MSQVLRLARRSKAHRGLNFHARDGMTPIPFLEIENDSNRDTVNTDGHGKTKYLDESIDDSDDSNYDPNDD